MLTRDQILKCNDIQIEKVSVPEWGGDVFVRSLTGSERDWLEASTVVDKIVGKGKKSDREIDMSNFRAKIVSLATCDKDGTAIFTKDDVLELSKKSAAALQRVFEVAQRLSGLTKEDADELLKN